MNRILAALAPDDRDALAPRLHVEDFAAGSVLHDAGQSVADAWFPYDAVVAHSTAQDGGWPVETGTVGCEGVVSAAALFGEDPPFERAVVCVPGRIAVLPVGEVTRLRDRSAAFRRLIGAYIQAYAAQVAQSVACNAAHSNEARLSRWLLMCRDRMQAAGPLPFDNRMLAGMLGVGRPTVTVVAGTLQTAGLIRTGPDGIDIVDREGLEEAACDCYGRVRRVFERLLPLSYR